MCLDCLNAFNSARGVRSLSVKEKNPENVSMLSILQEEFGLLWGVETN